MATLCLPAHTPVHPHAARRLIPSWRRCCPSDARPVRFPYSDRFCWGSCGVAGSSCVGGMVRQGAGAHPPHPVGQSSRRGKDQAWRPLRPCLGGWGSVPSLRWLPSLPRPAASRRPLPCRLHPVLRAMPWCCSTCRWAKAGHQRHGRSARPEEGHRCTAPAVGGRGLRALPTRKCSPMDQSQMFG